MIGEAEKHAAFRTARAALAASGTVTLELALAQLPTVAAYRIPAWEGAVFRLMAHIDTVILANLVLGEKVVPEYLQGECTPDRLALALVPLLADTPERRRQLEAFARLDTIMDLAGEPPSRRAAARDFGRNRAQNRPTIAPGFMLTAVHKSTGHGENQEREAESKARETRSARRSRLSMATFRPHVLTNAELARMVDTSDAWITERTGIKERHILKGEGLGTSHMGAEAVRGLLQKTNTAPKNVDLLICATTTPDFVFPSTANLICDMVGHPQHRLVRRAGGLLRLHLRTLDRHAVHRERQAQEGGRGRRRQDVRHPRLHRPRDLRSVRRRRRAPCCSSLRRTATASATC